jgi:transposase
MGEITVMGIDLAKDVMAIHGRDREGREGMRRTMGHEVRLMAPQYVKPYVKTNKNDAADAEAICEAATRPGMRFVTVKTLEQQDIASIHRVRERFVRERTALMNEIRGLLGEYGEVVPKGVGTLRTFLPKVLEQESLTLSMKEIVRDLRDEWQALEGRIEAYDRKLGQVIKRHDVCRRMMTVPGVGPTTATAMWATVGNPREFRNGRGLAAYFGLVPRQSSSGGRSRVGRIRKRGDARIRELLVHGARSVLKRAAQKTDRRSPWIAALVARRGWNKACVAVANRNARILWKIMTSEERYRPF